MAEKIRIAIDAKVLDGVQGGVQQFIIGLAQGLSQLTDGDETYIFFAYRNQAYWLAPHIGGHCQLHLIEDVPPVPAWKKRLKQFSGLRQLWHRLKSRTRPIRIPQSDGLIERIGIDLMHFPTQNAFLTDIPFIYHPWDLQHIHLPDFFTPYERQRRDILYKTFCDQATLVSVASSWIKQDVVTQFGISPEKIAVVPMASVLEAHMPPTSQALSAIRQTYQLPEKFAYYPAQTWQHKNHDVLLHAIAKLRDDQNITIPLVLSGTINAYGRKIQQTIKRLQLEKQVLMLGYIPTADVQALYHLCHMLVFPSRFEGWGLPITEAMSAGVSVICADVTHLSALVDDAGLLFDPDDIGALANAMHRLWIDEGLRADLIAKGYQRASLFSWERTARLFRAHYRHVLGIALSADEQALRSVAPLV